MAGLFALSINPEIYKGEFLDDLFWGTFYVQHLGEEYAGLSTATKGKICLRTHDGLFRPNFAKDLQGLEGTEGIGYCGPVREPHFSASRLGEFSLCFSGNIANLSQLTERFKNFGHTFERNDDIEIIAKLVSQGSDVIDGLKIIAKEIKGGYSLLVLTVDGIYAARCPKGYWPIVIGQKEGAVAIASESIGFGNLGLKLVRDLEPGEIILVKNGHWETKDKIPSKNQICSFYWVYTGFASDKLEGTPVSLVRRRLGALLARQDIARGFIPDIIAPIPDSGRFHAIGYKEEFDRQKNEEKIKRVPYYDEVLLKYTHAGRSFTPPSEEARNREAQIKLVESGENYDGKVVVVCDDSIVRGTQTQTNLVPKLKKLGFKEIHFRISNPELRSHCPWGKTTKKGETLVSRLPLKEDRIRFLGIESLEYNAIDDLVAAIGLPKEKLCLDCSLDNP